jgi:hypothetical protein
MCYIIIITYKDGYLHSVVCIHTWIMCRITINACIYIYIKGDNLQSVFFVIIHESCVILQLAYCTL